MERNIYQRRDRISAIRMGSMAAGASAFAVGIDDIVRATHEGNYGKAAFLSVPVVIFATGEYVMRRKLKKINEEIEKQREAIKNSSEFKAMKTDVRDLLTTNPSDSTAESIKNT